MTKQVTHSFQSVWDEMKAQECKEVFEGWCLRHARSFRNVDKIDFDKGFNTGASFAEKNLKYIPKVKALIEALKTHMEITLQPSCPIADMLRSLLEVKEALSKFEGSESRPEKDRKIAEERANCSCGYCKWCS